MPGAGGPDGEERARRGCGRRPRAAAAAGARSRRCERDERGQQDGAARPGTPTVTGSPQPSDSPRASPNTSANRPVDAVSAPGRSSRGRRGDGDVVQQARARDRGRDGEQRSRRTGTSASRAPRSARRRAAGRSAPPMPAIAGVDAERLAAFGGVGERRGQQRQRGGGEQRAEDALQRAGAHEQLEALCGARRARTRRRSPSRPPMNVHLRPNRSAMRPPSSSRLPNAQRVGGDHPLAVVVGEAEVLLRGRQRDVDDRHVEARPAAGRSR